MQKLVKEYLDELNKKQKKRRKAITAAVVLIAMVVVSVIGSLTQYGVAMTDTTRTARCGQEEHTHSDACYENRLVCGLNEETGHIHTEACYQSDTPLCGLDEDEGEEGTEGHIHTEACYESNTPICGQEESEGHSHTADCYEESACTIEEHTHTDICYSDTSADVEDANVWNEQYQDVEWEGDWGDRLVTAAKMQIGYQESADNYTIAEDGSHKGYTRYGQFAAVMYEAYKNNPDTVYTDWDAAFADFCMFYAGLKGLEIFPDEIDAAKWCEAFIKKHEANEQTRAYLASLIEADGYTPEAGDLVFFEKENEAGTAEKETRMGIVTSYNKEEKDSKAASKITVIEGDSEDQVRENEYILGDNDIVRYVNMAEIEKVYQELNKEPGEDETNEPAEEPAEKPDGEEAGDQKQDGEEAGDQKEDHEEDTTIEDNSLSEEEQNEINKVIEMIDALPDQDEITEKFNTLQDSEDEEGYSAYYQNLYTQVTEVYEAYEALTDKQKKEVTNIEKLQQLEWIRTATLEEGIIGGSEKGPLTEDKASIESLSMGTTDGDSSGGIVDGSAPWDYKYKNEWLDSNGNLKDEYKDSYGTLKSEYIKDTKENIEDGYDGNGSNRRVRTFDTIKYDFHYRTGQHDKNDTDSYNSARVYFEFLLPLTKDQAYFYEEETAWLQSKDVEYVYEDEMVKIGETEYQVLHGSFMDVREESEITAASLSRDVTIRVLNMENGKKVQPIFTMWLGVNDVGVEDKDPEHHIPNDIVYGSGHECDVHKKKEYQTVTPQEVTVTCTPRYYVNLKRGETSTSSYPGDFDFSTGNDKALDKEKEGTEKWNGRMSAYGIRLMVKGVDKQHGLRGCAFPKEGDTLEFDIRLTTAYQKSNENQWQFITKKYMPRVWSADEYSDVNWQGDERSLQGSKSPAYAAPYNKNTIDGESCRNGGTWEFKENGFADDGSDHRVIHVKVSGYDFDTGYLPYTDKGNSSTWEYYNPKEVGDQYWNIEQAVFSSGEIWVVTPFYNQPGTNQENYITNAEKAESLTMWQSIFTYDLKLNDGNEFKMPGQINHLDASMSLKNPGTYDTGCSLIKPLQSWNDPLTDGCFNGENELKDYATPGSYVDLEMWTMNDEADGDDVGVAYNNMIKFDNACFEPVGKATVTAAGYEDKGDFEYVSEWTSYAWTWWPQYSSLPGYEGQDATGPKLLYGTTSDKKGWNHGGKKPSEEGYDNEMKKAMPENLIWYDSMEALKNDGAECVAVMMENRNVANEVTNVASTMNHLHLVVHARIKDDVEPGCMYAITNYSAGWTKKDVKDKVAAYRNKSADSLTIWDYLDYTHNEFPSYSPEIINEDPARKMTSQFAKPSNERSWKRYTGWGNEYLDGKNGYGTWTKSHLDENNVIISGNGGYYYVDCVYVVKYKTEVGIQVAQTESNQAKSTYSMDTNQRVVDFKVSPRAIRSTTDAGTDGSTNTVYEDIEVEVTLPKGLEYIPSTSFWGGEYKQDSKFQAPGTLTGGEDLDVKIEKDENGTTRLKWILKDVPLKNSIEDLEPVYFSCAIGNKEDLRQDVQNNDQLNVRADIYSAMDKGSMHGTDYNNQANTSILIQKSVALTIIKTADQTIRDLGNSMGFTMKAYNEAESPHKGMIGDILPKSGIGQSSYHGKMEVEEFSIVPAKGVDLKKIKFYYTKDGKYSNITDITQLKISANPGEWTEFELDNNNKWIPKENEKTGITAIVFECTLPAKEMIEMHITLNIPDGEPGDILHNRLMLDALSSGDRCQIVTRSLEGLTWMDYNRNGIQDESNDDRISGIMVELLKLKDGEDINPENESSYEPVTDSKNNPIKIMTGKQFNVRTGTISDMLSPDIEKNDYGQGQYKFSELPAGIYAVRFTKGTGISDPRNDISKLHASDVKCGQNSQLDSDGIPAYSKTGKLEKTIIMNIVMPKAEDMSVTRYESKYHDSGFYPGTSIGIEKMGEKGEYLDGAIFTIKDSKGSIISFTKDKDDSSSYTVSKNDDDTLSDKYYIALADNPYYVIGINGTTNGSKAVLQNRTGSEMQLFKKLDVGDGYYALQNVGSDLYLDHAGGELYSGTLIQVWGDSSDPNHQWKIIEGQDGSQSIKPRNAIEGNFSVRVGLMGNIAEENRAIQLLQEDNSTGQKWLMIPAGNNKETQTDLSVGSDGKLVINNLLPGEYTITELKAPTGHALLKEPVNIRLNNNNTIDVINGNMEGIEIIGSDKKTVKICNYELYELPSTGGSGIYWYMFGGVMLMSTASLMTYRRRRKGVLRS